MAAEFMPLPVGLGQGRFLSISGLVNETVLWLRTYDGGAMVSILKADPKFKV